MDELERDQIRARLNRFLAAVIDAKGPKTVARDLTSRGWPYEEGTVRTWRGTKNPPPDVVFALAALYGTSLDEYATGEALEARFVDQLADHQRRLDEQEAWLHEVASSVGLELGATDDSGETTNLTLVRVMREVDALRDLVKELRGEEA